MNFHKEFLITRGKSEFRGIEICCYRYKACAIYEATNLVRGTRTHVIFLRKEDCRKYLSQDEIFGILEALGMRRDGSMKMDMKHAEDTVFFYQAVA